MRTMTPMRRLSYSLLSPIIKLILYSIWSSCRVKIIGIEHVKTVTDAKKPFIPCYWHQHHLMCTWYMKRLIKQGLKIGFLISPSVDGEIAANMAKSWGSEVIRGSTTRGGAQALRDMYNIVVKQGISPVSTSDGPQGPQHTFKIGDVLLAQFTQAPLLAVAYAADRAWMLNSWDKFIIPKPFSKVVVAVAEPVMVPKGVIAEDLEPVRLQMEKTLKELTLTAQVALENEPQE